LRSALDHRVSAHAHRAAGFAFARVLQFRRIGSEAGNAQNNPVRLDQRAAVLRRLQGRRFVEFHDLFDLHAPSPVIVVTFIALLELARESLLEVTQAEAFAPIYVRLAYRSS
jgi:segregation and condensation protein A